MNKLLLNLALAAGIVAMSSCNKADPNGTDGFNKTVVRTYALKRADDEKLPVIIDSISDTQKVTLHGEVLLVSVVAEKGDGLAQQRLLYFVSKETGNDYLSGYSSVLEYIDTNGFDTEVAAVQTRMAANVTPTGAP